MSRWNISPCAKYDLEVVILEDTVKARTESLRINKVRVQAGRATNVDVAQAETDQTNAEAQLAAVQQSRAETQNALSLLCGANADDLSVPFRPLESAPPPEIPVGLPASLLERRPDVAEAERNMASKKRPDWRRLCRFLSRGFAHRPGAACSAPGRPIFFIGQNSIWSFGPQRDASAFRRRPESFEPAAGPRPIQRGRRPISQQRSQLGEGRRERAGRPSLSGPEKRRPCTSPCSSRARRPTSSKSAFAWAKSIIPMSSSPMKTG